MDVVRYYLALSVIVAHFNHLTGNDIPWPTTSYSAVGGFFALSGYLIFYSYIKHPRLKDYLTNRAMRLLPPYALVVTLSAIGLCALSYLTPGEYFSNPGFWKYLLANLSFLNFLHPVLPGVFTGSEFTDCAVNGSLWTMKVEWSLYLSVPIVAWFISKRLLRRDAVFILLILFSVAYSCFFYSRYIATEQKIYEILSRQFFGQLLYFYTGVIVYFHYEKFMSYRWWILVVDAVLLLASSHIPLYDMTLRPFVNATAVLLVALWGDWGYRFSRHDNVSYDMYLFHFPIIQIAVYMGVNRLSPVTGLLTVITVTAIVSAISWNIVGRPIRKIRRG